MPALPFLGAGLGYRRQIAAQIRDNLNAIDFFELIGDEAFDAEVVTGIRDVIGTKPVVCHFLGFSLATEGPLTNGYLDRVSTVLQTFNPAWFSDHLAVTESHGVDIGHLSPVAFTTHTVKTVASKIRELKRAVGLEFLLENITYHFTLPGAKLTEWEMLTAIADEASCGILLDLNNLYVNSCNHKYDPYEYLDRIPLQRVHQVHIGGTLVRDGVALDTHGHPVVEEVFNYLRYVCGRTPISAVLLERDQNFADFQELTDDIARSRDILRGRSKVEARQVL